MRDRRTALFLALTLILSMLSGCGGMQSGSMEAPPGSRSTPQFKPGFNLFSPEQDVQLGRQSAQQILQETPMLDDPQIVNYIQQLGAKLAAKAAGERFPYQFRVVATKEINAFALPGGFLFVNAGTLAAAKNEGELAGVMAHEIAHAALRHGTNQASKQQLAQLGLGILGSIAASGENPDMGQAVGAIGGLGANMLFLKFGRSAEKQADLEGARIMAEAGYDPRDMAGFFATLQAQGGQRMPELLSDHPDPGNRQQYILESLPRLPVAANAVRTTAEFEQARARLTGNTPSLSAGSQLRRIGPKDPTDLVLHNRPPRPAPQLRDFQAEDGSFAARIPANWDGLRAGGSNYIFAPRGAYGQMPGADSDSLMVTHGIFVGVIKVDQDNLRAATEAFLQRQIETNADFQIARAPQQIDFGGQPGFVAAVAGPSAFNGVHEVDVTYTTVTSDGRLFYIITIVPEDEVSLYQSAFQQILRSLRLAL